MIGSLRGIQNKDVAEFHFEEQMFLGNFKDHTPINTEKKRFFSVELLSGVFLTIASISLCSAEHTLGYMC